MFRIFKHVSCYHLPYFPPLFLTCDDGKIIVYLKLLIAQH